MTLVTRIERGIADCEDALIVQRLIAALAQMMSAWPSGARETTSYRLAQQALADALALRADETE
ncbi:hypothetical protein [Thiofaba sp. EF100]|uniref:hypothetical protein n=1 Tax=Thiofaba sp. EF100 TaxID=3121274 RepID=UPI003221BA64